MKSSKNVFPGKVTDKCCFGSQTSPQGHHGQSMCSIHFTTSFLNKLSNLDKVSISRTWCASGWVKKFMGVLDSSCKHRTDFERFLNGHKLPHFDRRQIIILHERKNYLHFLWQHNTFAQCCTWGVAFNKRWCAVQPHHSRDGVSDSTPTEQHQISCFPGCAHRHLRHWRMERRQATGGYADARTAGMMQPEQLEARGAGS